MIRMIAMDLDGTLLQTDKSVSAFTRQTLQQCRAQGIKVVCATGRGGSAGDHAPAAWFDGRVLMNGAVAYAGEALVYRRLVPMQLARGLLLACGSRGMQASAELCDRHYANFNVTAVWPSIHNYQQTDFATHDIAAEKLYAIVRDEADIAFLQRHLPAGLYLTVSRDQLAQIMHTEATKARALARLAAHWGIDMTEVAAFGDDRNDVDMLEACGVGVAMGNALAEVQAAADQVCGTNDQDGVANWLLTHLVA